MKGFLVGHFTDKINKTGVTAILAKGGAVGGVDVRGSAPGTRETDLLRGCKSVEKIHAVVLSGGSAFGLEACDGVMQYLSEEGIGYPAGNYRVPIVCGAVLFDLEYGKFSFPNKQAGYAACRAASERVETGSVGAGTGATVGKILGMEHASKGGVGYAEMQLENGVYVGCVTAVNAMGEVYDLFHDGKTVAGARTSAGFADTCQIMLNSETSAPTGTNTTIGCILTNAVLTREQANKLAESAQDGLTLSIRPVHTMYDGDTMFALATCEKQANFHQLLAAAAEVTRQSVLKAVEK